jgi:hypothetical protein
VVNLKKEFEGLVGSLPSRPIQRQRRIGESFAIAKGLNAAQIVGCEILIVDLQLRTSYALIVREQRSQANLIVSLRLVCCNESKEKELGNLEGTSFEEWAKEREDALVPVPVQLPD